MGVILHTQNHDAKESQWVLTLQTQNHDAKESQWVLTLHTQNHDAKTEPMGSYFTNIES